MLRNSKEKRGESVEMESPEEPPAGGSLMNLLIEGNISEDSSKNGKFISSRIPFLAYRDFLALLSSEVSEQFVVHCL